MGRLNVLSLFSGIGAFEKALDNLGISYNLLAYCEIDKYASKSYSIIHNVSEEKNLKDVTQIDFLDIEDRVDLITYGFPCQDISNAGKQQGFRDENGKLTRSGLFFEALRIIDDYKPKFAIAENVKALTSKKFKNEFETVLSSLDEVGYNNYWAVLNSKDYETPQNRERVIIISIRKDIDKGFEFPKAVPLTLKLADMLDEDVDEAYYLSDDRIQNLIEHKRRNKEKGNGFGAQFKQDNEISCSLTTSPEKSSGQYLVVKEATKQGFAEAAVGDSVNLAYPTSKTRRGRVGKELCQTLTTSDNMAVVIDSVVKQAKKSRKGEIGITVHENGDIRPYRMDSKKSGISELQVNKDTNVSNTITTAHMPKIYGESTDLRIRKLTPSECFKLMGFTFEDCKKCSEGGVSNSQLYKQAGNSIVVNVLEAIFTSLGERYEEFKTSDVIQ